MSLPMASEAEMIDHVSTMVEVVRERMTAASSREYLTDALCDLLRRGAVDVAKIAEDADNGDDVADAALRRIYREKRENKEEPSLALSAYGAKAIERAPVKRGRGRAKWDNWRRDYGVAVLVFMTSGCFELSPTRNREQRHRGMPSASSIVAAALGRHVDKDHFAPSEARIQNIYARLQWLVWREFLAGYIESPSNPNI